MYYSDGDRYEGEFKEGRMNGEGVYCYGEGDLYEGTFVDDHRHGKGVMSFAGESGVIERYEGKGVNFIHQCLN